MAVSRRCYGSQPSQDSGSSLGNCMSLSMTVKRPYAATTVPFVMEEPWPSWDPASADCNRLSSGIFILALASTEPRSCPPLSKYGTCCTLSTSEIMEPSGGVPQ